MTSNTKKERDSLQFAAPVRFEPGVNRVSLALFLWGERDAVETFQVLALPFEKSGLRRCEDTESPVVCPAQVPEQRLDMKASSDDTQVIDRSVEWEKTMQFW